MPPAAVMRVLTGWRAIATPPRRAVITIGMFDGVHLGHQRLVRTAVRLAQRIRGTSVAITFDPDPQRVLDPRHPQPSLIPVEVRVRRLGALGVHMVWVIPFTRAFSRISAEEFVRTIVVRRLRARSVVVGETFTFGSRREGTLVRLKAMGHRYGFRVVVVPPVRRAGQPVSSSRIRWLVEGGELKEAARLLGHPIELSGMVVPGAGRGRTLGFPTANVRLVNELLPPRGVYRVHVAHRGRRWDGLMNLGIRPTFAARAPGAGRHHAANPLICEVYLIGFHGSLYGEPVTITGLTRLRAERRFESPAALTRQIQRDLARPRLGT